MALFYLPNSYDFLFSFLPILKNARNQTDAKLTSTAWKKDISLCSEQKSLTILTLYLAIQIFFFLRTARYRHRIARKNSKLWDKMLQWLFFFWTILLIWRHLFTAVYGYLRILTFFLQFIVFISQFRLFNPLRIARKKSEIKCHCYLYWLIVMWQKQTSMLQCCYCLKETFKTVTRFHSWFSCIMHKNDFKD